MDLDDAATLEVGPDGGLLRDLGSHLVDQVLWLLGPARTVHAELDHVDLDGGRTDCRFTVSITHASGVRSRVSASKVNHLDDRELRAYGSGGSYLARSTDVQAQAVFAGQRPADEGERLGLRREEHWGTLHTAAGSASVPSEQGAYQDYYTRFAAALAGDGDFPVPAEAVHTLEVLDAARTSAEQNRVVEVSRRLTLPGSGALCVIYWVQVARRTRLRRRSKLARPNIWRLIILMRLTVPSTGPEL